MFEKKHIFFFKSKSFKYAALDDYFWNIVRVGSGKNMRLFLVYYYCLILLLIIFIMNKIV